MTVMPVLDQAAQDLYDAISPTLTENDADYGFSMAYLCQALCASGLQPVYDYAFDTVTREGWSKLLDLNETPDAALPYLGQFVGVVLPGSNTPAQSRSQITTHANWNRGTPAALIAAVQATLLGSQRATIVERDTSPYHATINTFAVQTPNQTATKAAIAAAKPAGLIVALNLIPGPTFTQTQAVSGGTFAARKAKWATFADVLNYVP